MKYAPLLAVISCLALQARAQTYFYVDQIVVEPVAPTEQDAISIHLVGGLSSTGAYVVSASASVVGNTVTIAISAADPGGATVIVPHTEIIPLGTLDAGSYTIVIDGQAVGDLSPLPQHSFIVTGGGNSCDALGIESIQWHAFTDTAIVVHVTNSGSGVFDYPNFILFNMQGDTLAKETVNFFGIGAEGWHILRVLDDVMIPTEPFMGSLELWTGFTSDLACTWDLELDLCPPPPCAPLIIELMNTGGGLAVGTFSWTIYDENIVEVMNGSMELTGMIQWDADTICLEPGAYSMSFIPDQEPTGGQLFHGLAVYGNIHGPTSQVVWGLPALMEFPFYVPCGSSSNSIESGSERDDQAILVRDMPDVWEFSAENDQVFTVEIFDALGRSLSDPIRSASPIIIGKAGFRSGIYFFKVGSQVIRLVRASD